MNFKCTQYFRYTRQRHDRVAIKDIWIERAMKNPVYKEIQNDGRIRKWAKNDEEQKYLRIILLEDGETVHNAFFDHNFKEKDE